MEVRGTYYKWRYSLFFIDDGDQITGKIIWTLEANEECERLMNSKSFFLGPNGKNTRVCELECDQTMYVLTKDPIRI